jgi:hypothetical protein
MTGSGCLWADRLSGPCLETFWCGHEGRRPALTVCDATCERREAMPMWCGGVDLTAGWAYEEERRPTKATTNGANGEKGGNEGKESEPWSVTRNMGAEESARSESLLAREPDAHAEVQRLHDGASEAVGRHVLVTCAVNCERMWLMSRDLMGRRRTHGNDDASGAGQ